MILHKKDIYQQKSTVNGLNIIKHKEERFNQEKIKFQCNICGTDNEENLINLNREVMSCSKCHSTVRMRSIIHLLSIGLFGESIALPDFPVSKNIKGVGMSDWEGYAIPLSDKFDYVNTFYHQEPKLDITSIDSSMLGIYDFIISTDVYEHVNPPISIAFENTIKLMKNGGVFIFTVPFTKSGNTLEHFPDLNDYKIQKENEKYFLINITKDNKKQVFENLVFHGGPGSTLEMRVFSEQGVINELAKAGFSDIKIFNDNYLKYGIYWHDNWSLPILSKK